MSEHRKSAAAATVRASRVGQAQAALPPDLAALARGGIWVRHGTAIRMPRRTRLALVCPQMLKARPGGPAES